VRSFCQFCVLFSLPLSCGGQVAPTATVPASSGAPAPAPVTSATEPNTTPLRAQVLETPQSASSLAFAAPELGQHLSLAEARELRVQFERYSGGAEIVGLDVSLDGGRPRRLPLSVPSVALAELLSEDATLEAGSHWLFAALVSASGLVPHAASGGARVAKARRFFVGQVAEEAAGPSGAVWLRKPEGTYNGEKNSSSLLFDAYVFSALGEPLEAARTITLRSPQVAGRLQLTSPFTLLEVPSGAYEVSVSAAGAATRVSHFTVNRELGGGS